MSACGLTHVAALGVLLSSAGCARQLSAKPEHARVAPDSLIGVIAVTGTAFEQQVMLHARDRWVRLRTAARDSAALTRLGGVEVVVRGDLDTTGIRVQTFTVLRVDGQPVVDGVLRREQGHFLLETATGARLPLGAPPAAFPSLIGARLWVGGALDVGPNVYGVIAPPL